jgi:hypothetical protein
VAIEDRDWYRNDPPQGDRSSAMPPPRPVIRHDPRRAGWRTFAILAVMLVFWAGEIGAWLGHWRSPTNAALNWSDTHVLNRGTPPAGPAASAPPVKSNQFVLSVRPGSLKPAVYAGRSCVTIDGQDRICARYAIGEIPAYRLRAALNRAGYTVALAREP